MKAITTRACLGLGAASGLAAVAHAIVHAICWLLGVPCP